MFKGECCLLMVVVVSKFVFRDISCVAGTAIYFFLIWCFCDFDSQDFFPYLWLGRVFMGSFLFSCVLFMGHGVCLLGLPNLIMYHCYSWSFNYFFKVEREKKVVVLVNVSVVVFVVENYIEKSSFDLRVDLRFPLCKRRDSLT